MLKLTELVSMGSLNCSWLPRVWLLLDRVGAPLERCSLPSFWDWEDSTFKPLMRFLPVGVAAVFG